MTILEAISTLERTHTGKDRQIIGCAVQYLAQSKAVKYDKKEQRENGQIYLVNDYPETFSRYIFQEIDKHFLPKESKPYPLDSEPPSIVSEPKKKRKRIKKGGVNG